MADTRGVMCRIAPYSAILHPTVVLPSLRLDYLAIIHIVTILLAPEVTSSLLMSVVMGMLWVSVFMVTPRITVAAKE